MVKFLFFSERFQVGPQKHLQHLVFAVASLQVDGGHCHQLTSIPPNTSWMVPMTIGLIV